jgi:hypothetical protein
VRARRTRIIADADADADAGAPVGSVWLGLADEPALSVDALAASFAAAAARPVQAPAQPPADERKQVGGRSRAGRGTSGYLRVPQGT